MKEAPLEKVKIVVKGQEIVLDPATMQFNENTLTFYLEHEFGWIDYFGKQLEFAQKELADAEIDHDKLYSSLYDKHKEEGNTEKHAEAKAKSDDTVIAARKLIAACKENVGLLNRHLRAWDKNHDNVRSRGFQMQSELRTLGTNAIYEKKAENYNDIIG